MIFDVQRLQCIGDSISGTFYCHKSPSNSRELDVEIHYRIQRDGGSQDNPVNVQIFRVR
jgi:protein arginine N-methyltransferase 3